ncbi:T9SS type A sorting domain-containing protein [candidate division KSB1 bacterium]|nr:T9SS type A sorting domain-containing protein [candidate division KSB1 bacterium]
MKSFPCFSAIIFFIGCFSLHASIITVDDDGPADYQHICFAIDDAMSHDTILVAEGEYIECHYSIDKPLTLLGAGRDHTILSYWDGIISIRSDSVKIDGFTIQGGFMQTYVHHTDIQNCSPIMTNNTFIQRNGWGFVCVFYCNGSASPKLHYNNFNLDYTVFYLHNDSLDIHAEYNWWGTTNEDTIQLVIHDKHDDPSLGEVLYKPFLTQPAAVEGSEIDHLITTFNLYQNYPNPFNTSTTIPYDLSKDGHIRLSIYDQAGNLICRLEDGFKRQGAYTTYWNGTNSNNVPVSSGVYFSRLEIGSQLITKKLIIIK